MPVPLGAARQSGHDGPPINYKASHLPADLGPPPEPRLEFHLAVHYARRQHRHRRLTHRECVRRDGHLNPPLTGASGSADDQDSRLTGRTATPPPPRRPPSATSARST